MLDMYLPPGTVPGANGITVSDDENNFIRFR